MLKQLALRTTLVAFALLGAPASYAGEPATELTTARYQRGGGDASGPRNAVRPTHAALTEIASWLVANFDLPAIAEEPSIEFAQPFRLAAMRYKEAIGGSSQEQKAEGSTPRGYQREVVAVYDNATRTIFLAQSWTGKTAAEMSVLVHEMVHHLQNLGGLKYECPAAREKPAYLAQDRWLTQHGLDLEHEFQIDKFTLVVSSACLG